MSKARFAFFFIAAALTSACLSHAAQADDTIADIPADVLTQARWAKAERDKSNAWLAKNFQGSVGQQATPERAAGMPPSEHTEATSIHTDR